MAIEPSGESTPIACAPGCGPAAAARTCQLEHNLAAVGAELGEDAALTADAGYFSADNVQIAEAHGLDPYIATGRQKHSDPEPIAPSGPIPKHATPKQRMAPKNKTKQGQPTYRRRKAIVEPVFGQMQTVQGAKQLLLRDTQAARAQWRFHCAIHNLQKLHRAGGLELAGPHSRFGRFRETATSHRAAPPSREYPPHATITTP